MRSPASLLVKTSALGGDPAFIIACDEGTLYWLSSSFLSLGETQCFRIGDGQPVCSDGRCLIEVTADHTGSEPNILTKGEGHFSWSMSPKKAEQYAALVNGVTNFPGACHQYLETEQSHVPTVVVSKGEYDLGTIRKMRDL
jgi:hypothetical protein